MARDICFVCLSPILDLNDDGDEANKKNVDLYKKFLQFTTDYLKIETATRFLEAVISARSSFCVSCKQVVQNVCEYYLELVQAKLRLSTKLAQLGGLFEGSKSEDSPEQLKLMIENLKKLSDQLGVKGQVVTVFELRSLLEAKGKSG